MSALLAVAFLAALAAPGVAGLRRFAPGCDRFEAVAYGAPLGAAAGSLVLLGFACWRGLDARTVTLTALVAVAAALLLLRHAERLPVAPSIGAVATIVLAGVVLRFALLFAGAMTLGADGLTAGHVNLWGDWAQHLGDVSAFAYGDLFPPTHPRLAGAPFAYHWLANLTAAALVPLGLEPWQALDLHSFLFASLAAAAVFAFARRLAGGSGAAAVALVLFLFGGGLGAWVPLHDLSRWPWDHAAVVAANFRWMNVVFAFLAPQRAWLYGLPLGLLALDRLIHGSREGRTSDFVLAGVAAGLLPTAHLGTMLALAIVTPALVLLFPSRRWIGFFGAWGVVAAPALAASAGGAASVLAAARLQLGWIAPPDPWAWFWAKNLGLFLPLLAVALGLPRLLPQRGARWLLPFQALFVLANGVVLQPWDWDNTKLLVWWYLASCILVGALLVFLWERFDGAGPRTIQAAVVASLLVSGGLENVDQILGRDRHVLLRTGEVEFARRLREATPSRAVVACAARHDHPVSVLAGRRVVVGYEGWMWSQGLDSAARTRDLKEILALGPGAATAAARYGVRYVVLGPGDRPPSRTGLPVVAEGAGYVAYELTASSGATSGR